MLGTSNRQCLPWKDTKKKWQRGTKWCLGREPKFLHLLVTTRLSSWDAGATGTPKVAKKRRGNQFCLEAANDINGSNSQGRQQSSITQGVWPEHHCWFTLLPQTKNNLLFVTRMCFQAISSISHPLQPTVPSFPSIYYIHRAPVEVVGLENLENQISYPKETSSNPWYWYTHKPRPLPCECCQLVEQHPDCWGHGNARAPNSLRSSEKTFWHFLIRYGFLPNTIPARIV